MAVFAVAAAVLQFVGKLGEPVIVVAMGSAFILLSKLLTPAASSPDQGLGATLLTHPSAA